MVPRMKLHQHLGHELASSLQQDHSYQPWIKTHAGDEFGQLCAQLESLPDDIASKSAAVHDAYLYAMQCDLKTFSATLQD
ncbi:hypothetical protein Poly59_07420 [Rubripirellula reticaptiva]|uniref:Uncharacterized protein n=2 Tax=Rubripirellula reticaptiva TaxID=2528013 RepID=A0A5C6F7X8_9BACT|nr:hypothetical protein Poly59_07420 [Rubripirellula reticaptiva]